MEKILVISTFPPKGSLYGNKYSAVASYTKNTLKYMGEGFNFIVLSDILDSPEKYLEQDVTVDRCWKRNSAGSILRLIGRVIEHRDVSKVMFAFEFGMFGSNKILLGFIPLMFLLMRISGKKIYFVSHGVILSFSTISEQLGTGGSVLLAKVMNSLLRFYYYFLCKLSTKVIVFEEYLRQSLISIGVSKSKIYSIPHGVHEEINVPTKSFSREKLGIEPQDFVILCFGFLIWYKGSDFAVNAFKSEFREKNIKLIMGGGESRVHKNSSVYASYISNLYNSAKTVSNVKITGFIKEEDIKYYFSACDLVILPYRAFISASGPLSFAITYKKPFILSNALKEYFLNKDFSSSLANSNLVINDITFSMDKAAFHDKVLELVGNKNKLSALEKLSKNLYEKRRWSKIGDMYRSIIKP